MPTKTIDQRIAELNAKKAKITAMEQAKKDLKTAKEKLQKLRTKK